MSQFVQSLFSVENKTVVITGGTGVLGSVMAKSLAKAGAQVVVLGRRAEAGAKLVDEIKKAGGSAYSFQTDVLNQADLKSVKEKIISATGAIDILINAAGGTMPGAT